MIFVRFSCRDASRSGNSALGNPIPPLKKGSPEGSSQEKKTPYTAETQFQFRQRNTRKINGEIASSVTTNQVFQPNQRRNVSLSLRFSLPNSSVPIVNVTPQRPWGEGGSDESVWRKRFDRKGTQKILPNRPPALFCSSKKILAYGGARTATARLPASHTFHGLRTP